MPKIKKSNKELKPYYDNLRKREKFRGNEWFIEKSKELGKLCTDCEYKNVLMRDFNNHRDIVAFISYLISQNNYKITKFSSSVDDWCNRRVAALCDHSPIECVNLGGADIERLRFFLQQEHEPAHSLVWRNSTNQQEKDLIEKLSKWMDTNKKILNSYPNIGTPQKGQHEVQYIVYRDNWEVWFMERGSGALVFYTGMQSEIMEYILKYHA